MNTIHKYILQITENQTIPMRCIPQMGHILKIAWQGNSLCLWARVNTNIPERPVAFRIVGTGIEVNDETVHEFRFVETIFQGPYVWHIFVKWSA